jgi:hypothetical protein
MIAIFDHESNPLTPAMKGSIGDCLKYVQAHKVKLDRANLAGITLDQACLTDQMIHNASFDDAVLPQAKFTNCVFVECTFRRTNLQHSVFDNCIFKYCEFDAAELHGSFFPSTLFQHCLLQDAKSFLAQFHLGSTSVTILDSHVLIDDRRYHYPNCLKYWDDLCTDHDLSPIEQDQLLESLRHFTRMRELWLLQINARRSEGDCLTAEVQGYTGV